MRKVKNSATGLIRIDYIIDEQHCIFVNGTFTKKENMQLI
jgi:hypothetical protein